MSIMTEEAKTYYEEFRKNNQNLFAQNTYLFFPEHYNSLNYHLENVPNFKNNNYLQKLEDVIKKQRDLEESILRALGIDFDILNMEYQNYQPDKQFKQKKDTEFNEKAKLIIQQQIEKICINNKFFIEDVNKSLKVANIIKQELSKEKGELYILLDNLYNTIEKTRGVKSSAVYKNVLAKIDSYRFLADADVSKFTQARKREITNVSQKGYTIEQVISSVVNSLSGTMNNVKSRYDETLAKEFLNKKILDIKSVNGNIQVKATLPKGGKKVKADVSATMQIKDTKEKIQFGISNKMSSSDNTKIKLHSGGGIDALTKWIGAYKDTSELTELLKSNNFRMMLANELYSENKGEAFNALQQLIGATIYIWIGNEFMMENNALAQKLIGKHIGGYNIAFISSNRKLYRISDLLQKILDEVKIDKQSYEVNTTRTRKGKNNYMTQKRKMIKSLPGYAYAKQNGLTSPDFPYPQQLLNIGNAASNDFLKRIRYTINLDKNLLQP